MPEPGAGAARGTIVLIHGAWQGSWAFAAWQPLLAAAGWHSVAVDLPGNGINPEPLAADGLAAYTDHVVGVLRAQGRPCVVLGHSGGGQVAAQVAEAAPECVSALVFLVGMMLPSGMRFVDLLAHCRRLYPEADFAGITPFLKASADGRFTQVPPAAAREIFLHDCPPEAAAAAALRLTPQPEWGRAVVPALTPQRYGSVPRIYVEALADRSIGIALQREMQALSPGARRITLPCGHVPQLACPGPLTDALCAVLEEIQADV
ncbi:MAG TPA: alpha/beta hydrolase [Novosphingobium sp.]|nr:alpha/beta hydrolase [Novosphingobium sp.]